MILTTVFSSANSGCSFLSAFFSVIAFVMIVISQCFAISTVSNIERRFARKPFLCECSQHYGE